MELLGNFPIRPFDRNREGRAHSCQSSGSYALTSLIQINVMSRPSRDIGRRFACTTRLSVGRLEGAVLMPRTFLLFQPFLICALPYLVGLLAHLLTAKSQESTLACSIRDMFGYRIRPLAILFRFLRTCLRGEQSGDSLAFLNGQSASHTTRDSSHRRARRLR